MVFGMIAFRLSGFPPTYFIVGIAPVTSTSITVRVIKPFMPIISISHVAVKHKVAAIKFWRYLLTDKIILTIKPSKCCAS